MPPVGDWLQRFGARLPGQVMSIYQLQQAADAAERAKLSQDDLMRHRGVLEEQGQQRIDLSGQPKPMTIAQYKADLAQNDPEAYVALLQSETDAGVSSLDFATKSPAGKRIAGAVGLGPKGKTKSIKDLETEMFQEDPEAYYTHLGRVAEAKNPPTPESDVTGPQATELINQVYEDRRKEFLGARGYEDQEDLRLRSAESVQPIPAAWWDPVSGDKPGDSVSFKDLEEFSQIGSPAQRQAFVEEDSLRQYYPERRLKTEATMGDLIPTPEQVNPADFIPAVTAPPAAGPGVPPALAAATDRIAGAVGAEITPENDAMGRSIYGEEWDKAKLEDKLYMIENGFPTE